MGAFYFASSWNSTYGQCYDEPKMDTDDRCNIFCAGCKRVVCFTAPQDRKVREMVKIEPCKETGGKKNTKESQIKTVWKKVPRSFYVDVPRLDKHGKLKTDSNGPIYTRLYGEATCFHIAHQEAWKRHLHKQQAELVTQVDEATKKAEKEARKRRRKKKSKKAKKG